MSKYIGCIILLVLPFIGSTQTENYWTKKSDFAGLKRERAVAFSIGDYGYVGTGVDTAEIVHNDLWKYDPTLDTWTHMHIRAYTHAYTVMEHMRALFELEYPKGSPFENVHTYCSLLRWAVIREAFCFGCLFEL